MFMVGTEEGLGTVSRKEMLEELIHNLSVEQINRIYLIQPGTSIFFDPNPTSESENNGTISKDPEAPEGYYVLMNPNDHAKLKKGGKKQPEIIHSSDKFLRLRADLDTIPIGGPNGGFYIGIDQKHDKFGVFPNPALLSYPLQLPGGITRNPFIPSPKGSR